MSLKEVELFGVRDKVQLAIDRLKQFEPSEGYYLAFSGGKDSVVIKELVKMAGVKHDSHYSVTTIDPPELVYFIRKYHPDVDWDRPALPFLRKLETRGFPQRQRRWCCELYKENGGNNRRVVTGIRAKESYNRSRRKMFEHCFTGGYKSKNKTFVNPIIDWTTADVWEFIKARELSYCKLYDEGFKRLGCLFCPMATRWRVVEANRYPNYVKAFIRAFEKLHIYKKARGSTVDRWKDGEEMFWWWLKEDQKSEEDKAQKVMVFE